MKRHLLFASTLLLVLPTIAEAQHHEGGRPGGGGGGGARPERPGGPGGGAGRPGGPGGAARPERPTTRPTPPHDRPVGVRPGRPEIQPPRPGRPNPGRPNPGRPNPGRPNPGRPNPPPFRPGAGRPPNFRPIHRPGFRYPRGYAYRRWAVGLILPSLFLSSTYYWDDYAALGIGAPPPGYRWVRYGPDLLLVDQRSGRIADTIYGAFN